MSWEKAQRCSWLLHKATRAVLSQQMWDRSMGNAQPHLPVPSTPPQPQLVFLAIGFPVEQGRCYTAVSEGSLCPCTEPAEMMAMAAQPQAHGSGRAFPRAEVKNSFFPRWHGPRAFSGAVPPEESRPEPCRADPIRFLGATPSPTDTTCRFHQWTSSGLWRTEQLRANSRPQALTPQKSGQWGKN